MPPLCLHLGIARDAVENLHSPLILENMGNYLLGSTIPDIRIITGAPRQDTHFFDIKMDSQGSPKRFLSSHPRLASKELDRPTRAMVAGYLSHLITDEVWIVEVHRPFFNPSSPLGKDPLAEILDRAIQYELDVRERRQRAKMSLIHSCLKRAELGVDLGLVDNGTMHRWWEFVCETALREPSWELFSSFAQRFLVATNRVSPEQVESFLRSPGEMLKRVSQYIPERSLELFRSRSVSLSEGVVRSYIGEGD